jgi:uncharacterized SAM-binding protein YcdF (DUF218 family)
MMMIAIVVLSIVVWSGGFYRFAQTIIPNHVIDSQTRTDAIVVLTGGSGRLDVGLELLVNNHAQRLFISGVYQGIDVNQILQMFRENPGGLASRVEIGNAVDTHENAWETARWATREAIGSIRLVTAAYHMPRSLLEFRFRMPDVFLVPHPVFPEHVKEDWWAWPGTTWLVAKEYNKYLVVKVRQQIISFGLNVRQLFDVE